MDSNIVMTDIETIRERYHVALLGEETGNQLSLRVQEVLPGEGAPLHTHVDQAETFHIIRGTFLFQVEDEVIVGKPGCTFHIPKQTAHSFLYEGTEEDETGYLISVLTPGIHDGFITQIPELQRRGVSDAVLSTEVEKYGVKIVGPRISPS